ARSPTVGGLTGGRPRYASVFSAFPNTIAADRSGNSRPNPYRRARFAGITGAYGNAPARSRTGGGVRRFDADRVGTVIRTRRSRRPWYDIVLRLPADARPARDRRSRTP